MLDIVQEDAENNGEPGGTRTRDHRIKSAMLYQLSYRPAFGSGINFSISSDSGKLPIQWNSSVHDSDLDRIRDEVVIVSVDRGDL